MRPDAPYFIVLLCLMPDYFTRQGESAVPQWVRTTTDKLMSTDCQLTNAVAGNM
jgi:hypothetical protein